MRRTILGVMFGSAMLMGMASSSFAQGVNQREKNQQERIGQGVENGSLTPHETSKLENQEGRINREVKQDRRANGGHLTGAERKQVNRQQNRESRRIYNQKHDAQHQ